VEKLITSLRNLARAEAAEMAAVPPDYAPPLSGQDRREIADAILAQRSGEATGAPRAAASVSSLDEARRRRRNRLMALVVPAAAAAAIALALGPLSRPGLPPLPSYDVSATGGIKELRSGESAALERSGGVARIERIAPQMELVVVGRPDTAVEGPVSARTFLIQGDRVREAQARVQTAPSGAVEIRVRPADAGVNGPGRWMVRVLIGRPQSVEDAALEDALGVPAEKPGRRWLTGPIDVVE
jgi:hypothetical protein